MTSELMTINSMPIMSIQQAKERRQMIVDFTRDLMVEDQHYGKVPGTTKNTLLKPGAEMLSTFFGLSPRFDIAEKELDWTGKDHGGEPFFYFQYRCSLYQGETLAGRGLDRAIAGRRNTATVPLKSNAHFVSRKPLKRASFHRATIPRRCRDGTATAKQEGAVPSLTQKIGALLTSHVGKSRTKTRLTWLTLLIRWHKNAPLSRPL